MTPFKKRVSSKSRGPVVRRRLFTPLVTRRLNVSEGVAGFPLKLRTKLVYAETVSLDGGTVSTLGKNAFSLNGLFDPNITGTGHQPMGFDNYMGIYAKYTVIGARITATAVTAATATDPLVLGIVVHDGGQTIPTNGINMLEVGGRSTFKIFAGGVVNSSMPITVSKKVLINKELMLSYGENSLSGDSSNNPSAQLYGVVFAGAVVSGDPGAVTVVVRIEYDVEFHNPIAAQSAN